MLKIGINIYYPPIQELKEIIESNKDLYIPINGGSSLINDEWSSKNLLFDNTGDNISNKNKLLNEMTSIYWMWKNYNTIGNPDYIGHNHYRRFFKKEDINDYEKYDIIISKPIFSSNSISLLQQYNFYHIINDLFLCVKTIKEMYKVFGENFERYLITSGINYAPCNMFIMKKELFFEWCEFLFPILFELENKIDLTGRDNYQKRALCFLTERIFNFWCYNKYLNKYNIKEINMVEKLYFKPEKINERGDFS